MRPGKITSTLARLTENAAAARHAEEYAANISAADREKLAKEGKALKDKSYPIRNEADLRNAETLAKSGHGNVAAATALIKKRARELGVKHNMGGSEKADADQANDRAILAAINRLIAMQQGDTDSPSDAKVMAALQAAKSAQEADLKEE